MKILSLLLILICVSVCSISAQQKTLSFANSAKMFELLDGRWSFGAYDCQNPFVFSVASDRKSIRVTYKSLDKKTNKEENKEFTYKVIDADKFRIRAQIEEEKRLTDDGKPVVWDFYFFSRNEFRWHRTDWAANGFTPPAIRCKDDKETAISPTQRQRTER